MLKRLMQRNVVSNKAVAQFCGIACSIVGGVVLIFGIRRFEHLDLTEAQLYTASVETLLLSAAFIGLALIFSPWRKAA